MSLDLLDRTAHPVSSHAIDLHPTDTALLAGRQSLSRNALRTRLRAAKRAFTTRRIDLAQVQGLSDRTCVPAPGDLLLARVTQVRQHPRIENPEGRKVKLYAGDEIVVCYGDRYAPNQFEARVPANLDDCHLVAGGGVASVMLERHSGMKPATAIEPIGLLLGRDGAPLNVRSGALAARPMSGRAATRVLAVVGSSMDAGKTTTASHLIRGLSRAGLRVGAAKVTGTGSGGDLWQMIDAGANHALDFTDAGHASTYMLSAEAVERVFHTLLGELAHRGVDVIVLEVADGLYQRETAALLRSDCFARAVDGLFLAVRDALSAVTGCAWLAEAGLPLLGVTGAINMAPLSVREAEQATGLQVLGEAELTEPARVTQRVFAPVPVVPGAAARRGLASVAGHA
jgi:hypothetical protein